MHLDTSHTDHLGIVPDGFMAAVLLGPHLAGVHLPEHLLPAADCGRCKHRHQPDGGHCYMFREKPGPRCGQFQADAP